MPDLQRPLFHPKKLPRRARCCHPSFQSSKRILAEQCFQCDTSISTVLSLLLKLSQQMLIRLGSHMPNAGSQRVI